MEEGIYRMSLGESFLVLIIIGLWLFAVISLARKLDRICNPPSTFPRYSLHPKTSLTPSTVPETYPNDSMQSTRPSLIHLVRATSEPVIDVSPRKTLDVRSPSETCIHTKVSLSHQILSPSTLELGRSRSSSQLPHHNGYRIHVETTTDKPILSQTLLYPKRMPSIIRRSLLDLHRRALFSNVVVSNHSLPRCIVTTTNENHTPTTSPIMKKKYQRENAIDDDGLHKDSQSNGDCKSTS